MTHRQSNLQHIHKFSPFIKVVGHGLAHIHSHHHHSKHLHEHMKHLHIGNGTVSHKHEEQSGPIIHHRNGRHHTENKHPKTHHKKVINPLKFKF